VDRAEFGPRGFGDAAGGVAVSPSVHEQIFMRVGDILFLTVCAFPRLNHAAGRHAREEPQPVKESFRLRGFGGVLQTSKRITSSVQPASVVHSGQRSLTTNGPVTTAWAAATARQTAKVQCERSSIIGLLYEA